MKIIFSNHANIKIVQRKISRKFILETIDNPDLKRFSRGSREEFYKKFTKNHLKVVIKKDLTKIIVVTVHWVAKTKN